MPIFRKSKTKEPGNCKPFSLSSVPGKIMDVFLLESIYRHLKEIDMGKSVES